MPPPMFGLVRRCLHGRARGPRHALPRHHRRAQVPAYADVYVILVFLFTGILLLIPWMRRVRAEQTGPQAQETRARMEAYLSPPTDPRRLPWRGDPYAGGPEPPAVNCRLALTAGESIPEILNRERALGQGRDLFRRLRLSRTGRDVSHGLSAAPPCP
jgi:hypothetical protein